MQTIYNAQGESKQCDSVDAKEHIESGRWFTEAPTPEAKEEPAKRTYTKKVAE